MTTDDVARYLRHAELFGGLRGCWEVGVRDELAPLDLGRLSLALRELGARQKPGRKKSRTDNAERFALSRKETAALVRRLIESRTEISDVLRYTGASRSTVNAVRRETEAEAPPTSRNASGGAGCPSPRGREDARTPANTPRSHDGRTCAWCGAPLATGLRTDANYCPGGAHRQAAYRAKHGQAAA
jgi:hypothetical protein